MQRIVCILFSVLLVCSACEFKLRPNNDEQEVGRVSIERYDRLQSRYLLTGDFSALQQMNTEYPIETRTLVEKMLQIGDVSDHNINERFLRFYQDSTLQALISDAESEYANMDDLNDRFRSAFGLLRKWIPGFPLPRLYAQIGAFDQSIVVGEKVIGISLDKYMGAKYPLYQRFGYSPEQLNSMKRSYIVPDALVFYLLSLYPMPNYDRRTQMEKDLHMGKVMWTVNKATGAKTFNTDYVNIVDRYMHRHPKTTVASLLETDNYANLR